MIQLLSGSFDTKTQSSGCDLGRGREGINGACYAEDRRRQKVNTVGLN